jgi:hypothetical protein
VVIRGTAAAVALVAAALVGCSAEADPTPLPPLPSVSPTQVAPQVPPEATPATAQGAAAFAGHYLDVLTLAFQRADATELRALSDAGCGGCNNFIGAVEGSAAAREITDGGAFKVVFAEAPPVEKGEVIVELRYERAAARILTADGSVRVELPADPPLNAQMRLLRRGDGWVVLGFRAVE